MAVVVAVSSQPPIRKRHNCLSLILLWLVMGCHPQQPLWGHPPPQLQEGSSEQTLLKTIDANVPIPPPAWAVLERKLLEVMSEAAIRYADRYTRSGGTLIWRTTGKASPMICQRLSTIFRCSMPWVAMKG